MDTVCNWLAGWYPHAYCVTYVKYQQCRWIHDYRPQKNSVCTERWRQVGTSHQYPRHLLLAENILKLKDSFKNGCF